MKLIIVVSFTLLLSCSSTPIKKYDPAQFTSSKCEFNYEEAWEKPAHKQLNAVSSLYSQGCFYEVIALGQALRKEYQDKFYKVTSETAELFTPEGTFTDYVLEDYERGYLTLLISLSYLRLNQTDDALVELRRTRDLKNARIYNYGDDRILNLLLAALWDRFDTSASRPYWKHLLEDAKAPHAILDFVRKRIEQIDRNPSELVAWNITGFGYLPELDWQSDFFHKAGPYKIFEKTGFPQACAGPEELLVPTDSWIEKIKVRHTSSYHPLLYAKSMLRFPIGITYGVIGTTAGVAIGVGGCGVALYAKEAAADICQASVNAAGYIVRKSTSLGEYTLKPDLRHWENLPAMIFLSREPSGYTAKCGSQTLPLYKSVQLVKNAN